MNHALGLLVEAIVPQDGVAAALATHAPRLFDFDASQPGPRAVYALHPPHLLTAVVVDLTEDQFGLFDLLDGAARALAQERGARAWVVSCSSGDYLWVKAFDAQGERWSCNTAELEEHPREKAKLVVSMKERFGASAVNAQHMHDALPYWRLWAELSARPLRVLELYGSPLVELSEGEWEQLADLSPATPTRVAAAQASSSPDPVDELVTSMIDELVHAIEARALSALASPKGRKAASERPLHDDFEREDPEAIKQLYAQGLRSGHLTSADLQRLSPRFRASELVLHLLELFEAAGIELVEPTSQGGEKRASKKKPVARKKSAAAKKPRRGSGPKRR